MEQITKHFSIDHLHVVDSGYVPSKRYYIREILDSGSHEYSSSKLSSQQRREIISELGLDILTAVLDDCFRGTGKNMDEYNATKCAALTIFILNKILERGL